MLKTVFELEFDGSLQVNNFFFLEEDYIVAPTVYSTIVSGLNVMETHEKKLEGGFFGLALDPTEADNQYEPDWIDDDTWYADIFRSGPMTMRRSVFDTFRAHAKDFCTFDEYNWDWSIVAMQGKGLLPHTMLFPSRSQVKHIGTAEGMHADNKDAKYTEPRRDRLADEFLAQRFNGTKLYGSVDVDRETRKGYGGWGHPADQSHCLKLLES
jgi:alpha-1,6-mannosyl-glycoprotein beta-1,2-N-acetylglucosaminyltransferase